MDCRSLHLSAAVAGNNVAARLNGVGEGLQRSDSIVPVDAGVGDADTVLKTITATRGNLLVALVDVALNHETHDGRLALGNLLRDHGGNLGLVLVVLVGVAVRAVNHKALGDTLLVDGSLGLSDARGVKVGALGAAAQDDEAVLVAGGADNSDNARLGDGKEVVGVLDSANGINGNAKRAVGTVLEADGERQAGGQLTVQLGLGGTGANGTHREQIGQELRRDGIEHLGSDGHALGGQVDKELARQAQTLVDLEAAIDIGIVDQTLPADGRAGLLEVRAHDNEKLILVLLLLLEQHVAVSQGSLGVVDRAGADDDEQAAVGIGAVDDGHGLLARLDDGLFRFGGLRDLVLQQIGGRQRVVALDCKGEVLASWVEPLR